MSGNEKYIVIFTAVLFSLLLVIVDFTVSADSISDEDFIVKVGAIHLPSDCYNKELNYNLLEELIRKAADRGARIICTPEMALNGYMNLGKYRQNTKELVSPVRPPRKMEKPYTEPIRIDFAVEAGFVGEYARAIVEQAEPIPGEYSDKFCSLAKELNVHIVAGMLTRRNGRFYNSAVLINPEGEIIGIYDKVHLLTFVHNERVLTSGEGFKVFDIEIEGSPLKIGIMICYDREHPESTLALAVQGAEIILVPNACSTMAGIRVCQTRSRAFENNVWLVTANNGDTSFSIDYFGNIISKSKKIPDVVITDINLTEHRNYKKKYAIFGNYFRRTEKYAPICEYVPMRKYKRDAMVLAGDVGDSFKFPVHVDSDGRYRIEVIPVEDLPVPEFEILKGSNVISDYIVLSKGYNDLTLKFTRKYPSEKECILAIQEVLVLEADK